MRADGRPRSRRHDDIVVPEHCPDGATDRPGVYAGGDDINGADLVVTAIRDARIAATAMAAYLAQEVPAAAAS